MAGSGHYMSQIIRYNAHIQACGESQIKEQAIEKEVKHMQLNMLRGPEEDEREELHRQRVGQV